MLYCWKMFLGCKQHAASKNQHEQHGWGLEQLKDLPQYAYLQSQLRKYCSNSKYSGPLL